MVEILLNKYLELLKPIPEDVDKEKEIVVYAVDDEYHHQRLLTIINYGNHVKLREHYESYIGEVAIEKELFGITPSMVLRFYFPHLFK